MHARSQFFAIELNFPHLNFSNVLRVLALHVLENICFVVAIGHGTGVLHRSISHSTRSTAGHLQEYVIIEVLFVKVHVFQAIILLLYRTFVKVLKDALAHLGPYQTLTEVQYSDPGGKFRW